MTEEKNKARHIPGIGARPHVQKRKTEAPAYEWMRCWQSLSSLLSTLSLGFLLSGTPLVSGVAPLGCALIASLPRHAALALVGVWMRCLYEAVLGEGILLYAVCATLILGARVALCLAVYGRGLLLRARRLPDTVGTRIMLCVSISLCTVLFENIRGGASAVSASGLVVLALGATAFCLLYCFFFDGECRGLPASEAGLAATMFSVALSLAPFSIGSFSMGLAVSFAMTLGLALRGSATRSSAAGLLCGLALGGSHAPVLALAGLAAGIFSEVHAVLSGVSAVLVAICGALYFDGWTGALAVMPETIVSGLFITLLAMLGLLRVSAVREETQESAAVGELLARRREAERARRMNGISGSMSALSGAVRGFSERLRRPEKRDLSERCREIWRAHCKRCPNQCTCRGLPALETDRVSDKLASRLMATGKIDRERLYEITKVRCPDLDRIAAEISVCSARMLEEAIREDKTRVFAMEYEAMAEMFADAAAEGDMRLTIDRVLSDRLRRALSREGFDAENVVVCGDRKKFVIATGEEVTRTSLSSRALCGICEEVCRVRFGEPSFMIEEAGSALTLESLPLFRAECVTRQIVKRGERVSGDSASSVKNYDGFYYAFICDGMGSGEDAALTSQLCCVFLEKMLSCGNKKAITLEMLNHFLTARTTESFTTVDLVEIDLFQGVASFLKSGAVPSYVIRGGKLYKIASGTFPIGILPQVSAEVTEFELCDGDVILLCSDGVSSEIEAREERDPVWFSGVVEHGWTQDLDGMAERILAFVATSPPSDDMTVTLIRVRSENAASA